jgi:hypothetical protein
MWRTHEIVNRTAKAVETPLTGCAKNPVTSALGEINNVVVIMNNGGAYRFDASFQ